MIEQEQAALIHDADEDVSNDSNSHDRATADAASALLDISATPSMDPHVRDMYEAHRNSLRSPVEEAFFAELNDASSWSQEWTPGMTQSLSNMERMECLSSSDQRTIEVGFFDALNPYLGQRPALYSPPTPRTSNHTELWGPEYVRIDDPTNRPITPPIDMNEEVMQFDAYEERRGYQREYFGVPRCTVEVELVGFVPLNPLYQGRKLVALLDSGASISVIMADIRALKPNEPGYDPSTMSHHFRRIRMRRSRAQGVPFAFDTQAGTVRGCIDFCRLDFKLPELSEQRICRSQLLFYHPQRPSVTGSLPRYDMILGRDFMFRVGMTLDFATKSIRWGELASLPMRDRPNRTVFDNDGNEMVELDEVNQLEAFLPADYHQYHLPSVIPDHLTTSEGDQLLNLLMEHQDIMQGTLGRLPIDPIGLKLGQHEPIYRRPFGVPRVHMEAFKKEVQRLVNAGVLAPVYDSPWGFPSFGIPKKNGTMRFVTNFRELNKLLQRRPYPLPRIDNITQAIDGIDYLTSIDLVMRFYHVPLDREASYVCTTVLPFGKYRYLRLPMGLSISPELFQGVLDRLLGDLPFVIVWIDDILIKTKGTFEMHLEHIRSVFQRLRQIGMQINVMKSSFFAKELEYLGFLISSKGIRATPKKIEAIQQVAIPRTRTQLRPFLGMVNFIRQHIRRHSHFKSVLTNLLSWKRPFAWTDEHTKAFQAVKDSVMKATMLTFPDYSQPFEIYTDASKTQMGAVIVQRDDRGELKQPIAFYSKKLLPAQQRYTVTEQELLSIVSTLRQFKTMLFGYPIIVYTDHRNLTFAVSSSDRVIRWRLFVEQFGP